MRPVQQVCPIDSVAPATPQQVFAQMFSRSLDQTVVKSHSTTHTMHQPQLYSYTTLYQVFQ